MAFIHRQFVNQYNNTMTDHITQRKSKELKERSQSVRNIKSALKNNDYYGCTPNDGNNGLASKPSKEYNKADYDANQKSSNKNPNDHSDYIKNLYKKYLGKENQIQSQKKSRDIKITKNMANKEQNKNGNKLFQDEPVYLKNVLTQEAFEKKGYMQHHLTESNQLARNKSTISIEIPKIKKRINEADESITKQYKQMLNNQILLSIGDSRNSIVRCMKNIRQAKNNIRIK